jgi:hypothetical protein
MITPSGKKTNEALPGPSRVGRRNNSIEIRGSGEEISNNNNNNFLPSTRVIHTSRFTILFVGEFWKVNLPTFDY